MQDLMIPPTSNPKGMDATPIIKKTSTIIIPNAKAKRKGSFIKKQNKKNERKKVPDFIKLTLFINFRYNFNS